MALQSTGKISHADIMAEFEKTGQFKLSADGAALIDKTSGQIIKESDFYGKSNVPPSGNGNLGFSGTCFPRPVTSGRVWKVNQALNNDGYCGWELKTNDVNANVQSFADWTLPWLCIDDGSQKLRISYRSKITGTGTSSAYCSGGWRLRFEDADTTDWALSASTGANQTYTSNTGGGCFHYMKVRDPFNEEYAIKSDGTGGEVDPYPGEEQEHSFLQDSLRATYQHIKGVPTTVKMSMNCGFGNYPKFNPKIWYLKMETV